jgi:hypothetical protein
LRCASPAQNMSNGFPPPAGAGAGVAAGIAFAVIPCNIEMKRRLQGAVTFGFVCN